MSASILHDLARRINAEHAACEAAARDALHHALEAGRLLIDAKGQVQHGEWLGWIEANCTCAPRTAQLYMRVARRWPELESKAQRVADLPLREVAGLLAEPREADPAASTAAAELDGKIEFTPTGLIFHDDITFEQWRQVGRIIRERAHEVTRSVFAAGQYLLDAKENLSAHEFQRLTDGELPFGKRHAQRLMAIASSDRLRGEPVDYLPADIDALYMLTRLTDDEWAILEDELSWSMLTEDIKASLRGKRVRVGADR